MKPLAEHSGEEIKSAVADRYSRVATSPGEKFNFPVGRKFAESVGYDSELLDRLPMVSGERIAYGTPSPVRERWRPVSHTSLVTPATSSQYRKITASDAPSGRWRVIVSSYARVAGASDVSITSRTPWVSASRRSAGESLRAGGRTSSMRSPVERAARARKTRASQPCQPAQDASRLSAETGGSRPAIE